MPLPIFQAMAFFQYESVLKVTNKTQQKALL